MMAFCSGVSRHTAIVERFRGRAARWVTRPFDRTDTVADLSLLHRLSRLVTALDTSVTELFDVLDVVDADPSFPAALSFSVPVAPFPPVVEIESPPVPPDAGSAPVFPEPPLVRRSELPPQATKHAVTMSADAPTRMGVL